VSPELSAPVTAEMELRVVLPAQAAQQPVEILKMTWDSMLLPVYTLMAYVCPAVHAVTCRGPASKVQCKACIAACATGASRSAGACTCKSRHQSLAHMLHLCSNTKMTGNTAKLKLNYCWTILQTQRRAQWTVQLYKQKPTVAPDGTSMLSLWPPAETSRVLLIWYMT